MELRMARVTDHNALMRAILLIGLTVYLFKLVLTGDIEQYIHPKFTWFTASAGIGMLAMAGGQLLRGLRGVTGAIAPMRTGLYLVYTVVICAGFVIPPFTFGADLASKQGLNLTQRATKAYAMSQALPTVAEVPTQSPAPVTKPAPSTGGDTTPPPADSTAVGSTDTSVDAPGSPPPQGAALPGQDTATPAPSHEPVPPALPKPGMAQLVNGVAAITPKNFWPWMNELYGTPAKYAGTPITMEGFVFYPPGAGPEEFAITRLVVTCHVAHAYPDGLLVTLPGTPRPAEDSWFLAEGVLELTTFQEQETLRIKLDRLTAIPRPSDPYIYP